MTVRQEINTHTETTVVLGITSLTTFLPVGHLHFVLNLSPAGDEHEAEDQPTAASSDASSASLSDAPGPEPTAATEDAAPKPVATTLEEVSSPTEVTRAETGMVAEEYVPPPAAVPVEDTNLIDTESPLGEAEEAVFVEPVSELEEAEELITTAVVDAVVSKGTEAEAVVDTGAPAVEEEEAIPVGEWSICFPSLSV